MRHLVRIALFSTVLVAQPRAAVEYRCSAEDIDKFALECSSDRPCPVYLELSAADSATGRIFVTGNLHTESATLYSVLLASDDGGETWTEPHPRIPFSVLEQIQFVDLQNGWVSGQSVQNGPRDPFLLATSDGGKSWKQKPVSEEPRPGAVEQFWFDSRNTGVLLVDRVQANETGGRHERYRTMTGGDSGRSKRSARSRCILSAPAAPSRCSECGRMALPMHFGSRRTWAGTAGHPSRPSP